MEKYKTFYPGKYDDEEQRALDMMRKNIEGNIGKPGMGFGGPEKPVTVTEADLLSYANTWDGINPMYCDKAYAEKSSWGGVIAYPGAVNISASYPMMNPVAKSFGDFFYYGVDGGEFRFFRAVRPGDVLTTLTDKQEIVDVTDPDGSPARKFKLIGESSTYDQDGNLVAKLRTVARNSMKRIIDGSPVPSDYDQTFEWKTYDNALTPHITTDEEWETIKAMWDAEKIRGAETLYWEDVNVGDEPTPTCSGPVTVMDLMRFHGKTAMGLPSVRHMMNSNMLMKDHRGMIYNVMARHYFDCHQENSGALFYNITARDLCIRTVTNWMGDDGLVVGFGWQFCNTFRDIFDPNNGRDLLAQVPYMAGRYVDRHGFEGDTVIGKAYVTKKYKDDTGAYVDLVVWGETLDGDIVHAGPATVKLPTKA